MKASYEQVTQAVIFDNTIPYGNGVFLGAVRNETFLEVSITPEPKNAPESLWFCFRLLFKNRSQTPKKLRLIIKHFSNSLGGLPAENINPVTKSANGDWERMASGKTVPLPDGRFDAVWETTIISDSMDFAFCFPYGEPEIDDLVQKSKGYWTKDIIGISPENRNIIRLSNNYGSRAKQKPGLCLVARQHSGETPASWVLHGFLEEFAAKKINGLTIWCLPLTNIDGIEKGFYGKDNFPIDINRAWGHPPMRYENKVFQNDIVLWGNRTTPFLALDFHSPGGCENKGAYCFLPQNDEAIIDEASLKWSEKFKFSLPFGVALENFGRIASHQSRWTKPCSNYCNFMNRIYDIPSMSFEFPYSQIGEKILEIKDYLAIGKAMANCIIKNMPETLQGIDNC